MSRPPLRPFARGAVPLPTGAEAAAFDRHAIGRAGVPEAALMESAGRTAAVLVQRLYPAGPVVGLAGDGNNGGDALVLLRTLAAWRRPVRVLLCGDRPVDDPLLHGWELPAERDTELDDAALAARLRSAGVVVDGLLGTGLRGEPRPRQARVLEALATSGVPAVALDVPSGVDAVRGSVPGAAVRADLTVAFGWPKLGTLLQPARSRTGRLVAVEIGFPPPPDAWLARLLTPAWAAGLRPSRAPDAHKNTVGSLLVVAGSRGMAGAAVLAARSAIRAGIGYVRLASVSDNREILQEAVPDATFVDATDPGALAAALAASSAVAAGPGLGTGSDAEDILASVLGSAAGVPLVLDADALNLISQGRPAPLAEAAAAWPLVVTPHPGEMARLTGRTAQDVQADRPAAARALAGEVGCTVLLKGLPSLVASPGGWLGVAGVGGSELAAAGMGDVLTGAIGALMGQGVDPAAAAGLALITTARAAARVGFGPGLAASDLPDALPAALADLGPGDTDLADPWVVLDLDEAR